MIGDAATIQKCNHGCSSPLPAPVLDHLANTVARSDVCLYSIGQRRSTLKVDTRGCETLNSTSRNQQVGRLWMLGFLGYLGFLGFQFPVFLLFFGFFLFFGTFLKGSPRLRFVEAVANSAVHSGLAKGARRRTRLRLAAAVQRRALRRQRRDRRRRARSANDGGAHREPGARADANEARARLERVAAALAARLPGT